MRNVLLSITFTTAAIALVASPAFADTVTIGSLADATIFANNVNNSNGAGPGVFSGGNGTNSPRRGLISFDIASAVPTGATITDVAMTLFLGQSAGSGGTGGAGDSTPRTISLFAVTSPWGEGTTGSTSTSIGGTGQGFPANTGDATWNANKFNQSLWTTPGGDHVATASASLAVDNQFQHGYVWGSTAQMVADVQGWLSNPSSNFGWEMINADENVQSFRSFYTKEWMNDPNAAAQRPILQITFLAPVPLPAAVWLFGTGVIGLVGIARRKTLEASV